jgi:hypothetical protein
LESLNEIVACVVEEREAKQYTAKELNRILDSFEKDNDANQQTNKLRALQKLYTIVHRYFMRKSGYYELPLELADIELEDNEENKEIEEDGSRKVKKDLVNVAAGDDKDGDLEIRTDDSLADF